MNILVTGANGQLGTEIRLRAASSSHRFIFSDVSSVPEVETIYLDITNRDAVSIIAESEKVDVIINCAAYTDVEKAESDMSFAELLNRTAPANLAAVAADLGATLIHISTDYVFHGDSSVPYVETDQPNPTGVYGVTKLAGEKAIIDSHCKYLIFRTAWMYSPFGKNFVKTVRRVAAANPEMKVVFDQIGTPTYAADLADLIVGIIDRGQLGKTGIYHYTDEGVASWFDFARAVAKLSGLDCDIKPCKTGEYPTKVRRPAYSVLDKTKVRETFGIKIPYWTDSLKDCIDRLD